MVHNKLLLTQRPPNTHSKRISENSIQKNVIVNYQTIKTFISKTYIFILCLTTPNDDSNETGQETFCFDKQNGQK